MVPSGPTTSQQRIEDGVDPARHRPDLAQRGMHQHLVARPEADGAEVLPQAVAGRVAGDHLAAPA